MLPQKRPKKLKKVRCPIVFAGSVILDHDFNFLWLQAKAISDSGWQRMLAKRNQAPSISATKLATKMTLNIWSLKTLKFRTLNL